MACRIVYPASSFYNEEIFNPFFVSPRRQQRRRNFEDEIFDHLLPGLLLATGGRIPEERKCCAKKDENKEFLFDFKLEGFDSSEIKVKVIGHKLVVDAAKEEEENSNGLKSYSRKEYHKSLVLPDDVNVDALTSQLNDEGVLRIQAPFLSALSLPEEKEIAVTKLEEGKEENNEVEEGNTEENSEKKEEETSEANQEEAGSSKANDE